ncbi:MAG: hypothetical protein M3463_06355 [Verrucomicrobiota bacterium]|nr:hypothetical protein [Verrucomicrobiota bacterium]
MRAVKFAAPCLVLLALSLNACNTLVNRRDQYRPAKPSGPYNEARSTGSWRRGVYPKAAEKPSQTQVGPPRAETSPLPPGQ